MSRKLAAVTVLALWVQLLTMGSLDDGVASRWFITKAAKLPKTALILSLSLAKADEEKPLAPEPAFARPHARDKPIERQSFNSRERNPRLIDESPIDEFQASLVL